MKKSTFYLSWFIIAAIAVSYLASLSILPERNIAVKEEATNNSKRTEKLKNKLPHAKEKSSKRISVKSNELKSPLVKIADSKMSEYNKVRMMREHILSSKYQLKDVIGELKNAANFLSEDSIQELLFLSLRHCSKTYPFEIYESLMDGSLEKLGFEEFLSNENDGMLVLETLYTGLLESGESEFLKDLKTKEAWLIDIKNVAMNLGKDEGIKWAVKNREILSDKEFSGILAIGSSEYKGVAKRKAAKNYNYAVNWAKTFEKGSIEAAYSYSNIAIQQYENERFHNKSKEWVKDLEPGFAKDRTTLGFALGASRYYEDKNLEKQLKNMFIDNNFKVDEALLLIQESTLPAEVKNDLLKSR